MRIRGRRISQTDQAVQNEATRSLKLAFKHEVRPEDYLFKVWLTALAAAVYLIYATSTKSGNFDLSSIMPAGGTWQSHDPAGGLYLETWSTILVNCLQAGFALWGAILLFLGLFRVFSNHKYVFACFYLGCAFLGFALVLPNWTQTLLNMLIEKCPLLVQ
jgi:hypothetical protein